MLRRNPDVLVQILDDEALLLLPTSDGVLHLNRTATAFWELLEEPQPLEDVARQLAKEFQVPADAVLADLRPLVENLVQHEAIRRT